MQSNRKKILSVLLALILALGVLPVPLGVSAAQTDEAAVGGIGFNYEDGEVDPAYPDYEYLPTDDGAKIVYYNGEGGDITIPSHLGGLPVTSIGNAFAGEMGHWITSVVIPDTVVSIESDAFAFAANLKSVTFPDSLKSIGNSAFWYCMSLQEVYIPDSVTSIDWGAFVGCESLKKIHFPDSLTEVYCVGGCEALEEVNIPASCTEFSFRDCKSLKKIDIPDTVVEIGAYAFRGCESLREINIPDTVVEIGYEAFGGCESLEEIIIPTSCEKIGEYAFYGCQALREINIPASVTEIGEQAINTSDIGYSNVTKSLDNLLERITVDPANTVYDSREDCNAVIETAANTLICGCQNTVIPDDVTAIADGAFNGCADLKELVIPDTVTEIGERAFEGCSSLTSVTLPPSLTEIKKSAFKDCAGLKELVIPDTVTEIGNRAYEGCSSLTSVEIPDTVAEIGSSAFEGCSSLTSVKIPDSVTEIGWSAFEGCSSLTSVKIPDAVTEIGWSAFRGCSSLTSVTLPESLTTIGFYAFDECPKLLSLTVPKSVRTIGDRAFGTEIEEVREDYYDGGYRIYDVCKPIEGFTLYGYYGSEAEAYSKDFYDYRYYRSQGEIPFVSIDVAEPEANGKVAVFPRKSMEHSVTEIKEQDFAAKGIELYVRVRIDYEKYSIMDDVPFTGTVLGAYEFNYHLTESKGASPDEASPDEATPDESSRAKNWNRPTVIRIRTNCPDAQVLRSAGPHVVLNPVSTTYANGWLTFETDSTTTETYIVTAGADAVVPACGDFDGDGELDATDVTFIQRTIVGMMTDVDEKTRRFCDVDGNGELEIIDSTYIQRYLALMNTPYPVGERF